jgi:hypothetical protein
MKLLILLFFSVLIYSCDKQDIKTQYPEIVGEYEWHYSSQGIGDSHSFENVSDKYAIHILDNGKLIFIRNGEKVFKKRIVDVADALLTDGLQITIGKDEDQMWFTITDDILTSNIEPFDGYVNEYKRMN